MSIDLSQFHQVFFEESFEGLDIMESSLMELDPSDIDLETINAVFRSAHSIKGGSATFGFKFIAEFTHDLETILDEVRNGKRAVSSEDVDVYLKSVDCMRGMLSLLQDGKDTATEQSENLKNIFANMLNKANVASKSDEAPAQKTASDRDSTLWRIRFVPGREILKTGNEVTRLFRELRELGTLKNVHCDALTPALKILDPEECYLSWTLELETDQEKEFIQEVFEWIEEESEILIEPLANSAAEDNGTDEKEGVSIGWDIAFVPDSEILRTGNDPYKMFESLQRYGELKIHCLVSNLPKLALMDSETCYLSWRLELKSDVVSTDQIREVFEWVLDEARLDITPLYKRGDEEVEVIENSATPVIEAKTITAVEPEKPKLVAIDTKPPVVQPGKSQPAKINAEASSIRVGIDKVDNLINMVGELVITQSMLGQLGSEFDVDRVPKLLEGLGQLEQNTRELQESVMRIRMLPISFAFSRFPRMVRDLGQKLGKKIKLQLLGEQTELDKTVMEKIGDPLVHLVRNAVDHGIELPDQRTANGKSAEGTITLNAYHQGGNVVIEVNDDGKGLNREKIIAKASERGIVNASDTDHMADEQVFDLIFQPGFSTAEEVSDVSGRGVGMDVVKRNIQALNGNVEIRSEPGLGSTITIRLPLTLAILDGQLVRVGNNTYIFPLVSIVESLQISREFINQVAGGCSVFKLRDDYVPIIELYKTFSINPDSVDLEQSLLVVVEYEGEKVGIVVDELLAQQQVVIKSLEQNYKRVDGISGATILGDGTVALILDIVGIVKLAGTKFVSSKSRVGSESNRKSIASLTTLAG